MKQTNALAASLLSLLTLSSEVNAAKVVQMDIAKHTNSPPTKLRARADFSESIVNNVTGGSYEISTSVGTPGQSITLVLDTGSSDVFVLSSTANQCTSARLEEEYGYCSGGTFNSNSSSTYKLVNTDFDIEYADGSASTGDYFTDTFTLSGSHTITSQRMGLALKTTVGTGIMGIGYDTNEASTTIYPSVIDNMVSQGLISTKAYSLWLNDLDASTGSILFGGIDTDKYHGTLVALPIETQSGSNVITSFTVALTAITAAVGSSTNTSTLTNSTFVEPVVLDSGTTLTYLPDATTQAIYNAFNVYDATEETGEAFIDCKYLSDSSSISYSFGGSGGPTITVALSELVFDYGLTSTGRYQLPFASTCIFGLQSSGSAGINLLGDTFLRSAYVVYDISANQVALAQTNFNSTDTNVVEISASATSIPGVTGVASSATVAATGTDKPGVGNAKTTTILTNSAGSATATVVTTASATSSAKSEAGRMVSVPFAKGTWFTGLLGVAGVLAGAFMIVL